MPIPAHREAHTQVLPVADLSGPPPVPAGTTKEPAARATAATRPRPAGPRITPSSPTIRASRFVRFLA